MTLMYDLMVKLIDTQKDYIVVEDEYSGERMKCETDLIAPATMRKINNKQFKSLILSKDVLGKWCLFAR